MELQYSNREIDRMFLEIQETLGRIEVQTKQTNGKVASLSLWRAYMAGAIAVLSVIAVPICWYTLNGVITNASSIQVVQAQVQLLQK